MKQSTITYNGEKFKAREVDGLLFAHTDLGHRLFVEDYKYRDAEAEEVDNEVAFYLDSEEFDNMTDDELTAYYENL